MDLKTNGIFEVLFTFFYLLFTVRLGSVSLVVRFKNRAARIITNYTYATPTSCLLCDLGWDTLEQGHAKQLALTMYKAVNGLLPAHLHDIFNKKLFQNEIVFRFRNDVASLFLL